MRALLLLLALVGYASAYCLLPPWREFVFAKGQAKVVRAGQSYAKDLRVDLEYYYPGNPSKGTVLATSKTDDTGFYVIAGSAWLKCYALGVHYRLRLYDSVVATYHLAEVEVPREFVLREGQPVKVVEKDIKKMYIPQAPKNKLRDLCSFCRVDIFGVKCNLCIPEV